MLAESTPFGLDKNWLTLIGTFVALAIAVGNGVIPKLWKRVFLSRLSISFDRVAEFSSEIDGRYWLRLPIANSTGKYEAKNVEVFLEDFAKLSSEGPQRLEGLVPMRLKWCSSGDTTCNSIPSGSFRLLELGYVDQKSNIRQEGQNFEVGFPTFSLSGEVAIGAHSPLALGSFLLTLTISAEGIPTQRQKIQVVVRKVRERAGFPAKVEKA